MSAADVGLDSITRFEEGEPTLEHREPGPDPPPQEGGPAGDGARGPDAAPAAEEDGGTRGGSLRLSRRGARFIARFEGFVPRPYNDAVGHCTVGYGHLIHLGACRQADLDRYTGGVSGDDAVDLLRRDARAAAETVRRLAVELEQPQFDALVSFTFNLGGGWTARSGLRDALLRGDHAAVPAEMSKWVYAGGRVLEGLVNRRRAEGRLYSRGTY